MSGFKKTPDPVDREQLEEVLKKNFGEDLQGLADAFSSIDPDGAGKKAAGKKARRTKVEEASGGDNKGLSRALTGVAAAAVIVGLVAVSTFAVSFIGRSSRNQAAARRTAEAERLARAEARTDRRNQVRAEAVRRINEIHQPPGETGISVVAKVNGSQLRIPLLLNWRTAPIPPLSEDGYRPVMAFAPPGGNDGKGVLWVVSGPTGGGIAAADPLAAAKAAFTENEIVEAGEGALTVVVAGAGETGSVRHIHSFLSVNGGLVRLSALNVSLSAGAVESQLKTLRQWRTAFLGVNSAAK